MVCNWSGACQVAGSPPAGFLLEEAGREVSAHSGYRDVVACRAPVGLGRGNRGERRERAEAAECERRLGAGLASEFK